MVVGIVVVVVVVVVDVVVVDVVVVASLIGGARYVVVVTAISPPSKVRTVLIGASASTTAPFTLSIARKLAPALLFQAPK